MARGISPPRWAGSGLRRGTQRRHLPSSGRGTARPGVYFIFQTLNGTGQAWIQGPPGLRMGLVAADSRPSPRQRAAGVGVGSRLMLRKALLPGA